MQFVNVGNTILFGLSGRHEQSDEGQGYSLPADVQYVDARWEIPVVLPLRDCLTLELNMLCHLDGYPNFTRQSKETGVFKRSLFWYQWLGIIICETIAESFCPLCFSPLSKSDLLSLSSCQNYDILDAACCSSCRFQIFPKDPSLMEHFLSVLPQPLLARAKNCSNGNHSSLRKQIQDCLLSKSEDET
ncbi:hypothetical protein Q3G72_001985 [Acer saccharum]|nr:hypothetical protein Q3G72_001985 [Acer saccharum]